MTTMKPTCRAWRRAAVSFPALALAAPALAQTAASPPMKISEAEASPGDTIIVTGTRRTDRTVTESAVPVDVFSAKDLAVQASPDLKTILKNLVPSFNQQRNTLADGSAFVRPPTLRGLPPDQILVLVNGKRMHRSALVNVVGDSLTAGAQGPDLSQIPTAALGRVEVLRDGAAAQYGSDAIAGVINLGLKTDDHGLNLSARYGQTYQGDGEDVQLSANAGFKLGEGYINVTGEYIDQQIWSRSVQRPDALVLESLGFDVPDPVVRYGQPKNQAYRFVINSAVPVGDKDEIYFFGNYGYGKNQNDFNYRRPIRVVAPDIPGNAGSGVFNKSINTTYLDKLPNGNWDANGRTFEASQIFPNGFIPQFKASNEDMSAVIGYRGETEFGMTFDFSAATGRNRIRYNMTDTLNPSLGPNSPTAFYLGYLEQRETNFNLDVSYPVEFGLASPLNIAGGLEFRREGYVIGIGDQASYITGPYAAQTVQRTDGTVFLSTKPVGAQGFPGYGPDSTADGARNSYSAYVDLETDIVESFTLGAAARFDHFSDFGSTFNGKLSARWAINDAIALRGAISTGFRAPTPGQLFTANVQTGFPNGSLVPVATATVTPASVSGLYFGSQPLKPEKSLSFSGGIVLTPGSGFNFTADYYNITVRDRIGIIAAVNLTNADRLALAALGVSGALDLGRVNYFTNGFKTRTQGVDFVLTHRADTNAGSFSTSLAIGYNDTKVTDRNVIALSAIRPNDTRVLTLIDDTRKANIEGLLPKWRAVLGETWTSGMFDVTARGNYASSFTSYNNLTAAGIKTFGAEFSFDLEVGLTVKENYRIAVGVENLFDNYPDRETRNIYPSSGSPANGNIYPDGSPLGAAGGFWYVRASAKF